MEQMRLVPPLRVVVDDRVRVPLAGLPDEAAERLRSDFTHDNPARKNRHARGEPRTIATWREEGGALSLPRGGCARVCRTLDAEGVEFELDDRRTEGDAGLLFEEYEIPDHRLELRPYQAEALDAALARENCIVHLGTGGGKTTIATAFVARVKLPTLVIVPDVGLLDQWTERVVRELGLREDQVGRIGEGTWRVRPITVATDDTLHARPEAFAEIAPRFGVAIYDEVHGAAARTIYAIVDAMPARYRLGFSNDSTRKDKKEFLVHDLFGAVAYEKTARELAALGFILDVEVRVVPTGFAAPWYRPAFLRAMQSRNRAALGAVQRRLVEEMTSDAARNELIADLVVREAAGAPSVVLSQRVEHAVELDRRVAGAGVRSGMILGGAEWKKQFKATVSGLKDGTVRAGLGTIQAFGTGKDVPAVANVFVVSPLANHRQNFAQVKGRACRLGKDSARLWYFWDKAVHGLRAVENLVRWNRTVVVWSGGEWVAGRAFLRSTRAEKKA